MRKPLPGEKPSGDLERIMKEAGLQNWKLEPHEIKDLRKRLTEALEERKRIWMEAFRNKSKPPN